jgi:hypothetical protein
MKLKTLNIITAAVCLAFGIGFILVPAQVVSMFGVTADEPMKHIEQLYGTSLIAFAFLAWASRNSADSESRRAIVLSLFVYFALAAVMAFIYQLKGIANSLGWSIVALHVLLALGYGYFQFLKPTSGET